MNIYDCHLHSDLSNDSRQNMEEYVKAAKANGDEYFISTEHMDLESNSCNGLDILPDFDRQQKLLKELSDKYGINMLFGVEMGYRSSIVKRNEEIICKYPFDMVILSVHESEEYDVAMGEFKEGKTVDESYGEYLDLIYKGVTEFDNFDTLGHIDYILRYTGHTDLSRHQDKLKAIMTVLIKKGKALEINTKTTRLMKTSYYTEFLIDLYVSLGGSKITLGSDCHRIEDYKAYFSETVQILLSKGIDSLCFYKGRQEFTISLKN